MPESLPQKPPKSPNFSGQQITDTQLSLLNRRAKDLRLPLLIRAQMAGSDTPHSVAALVPASDLGDQWIGEINEHFIVGVSEPFVPLSAVHSHLREAETALHMAQSLAQRAAACPQVPPIYLDRIDMASWLLAQASGSKLAERSAPLIQALKEKGLYETALTFLACNQSVPHTAQKLYLHSNTVRYRLQRIQEVLGKPISDPLLITNLTLCLHPELTALKTELGGADF